MHPRFRPLTGGHAPGHLREAFLETVTPEDREIVWFDSTRQQWWDDANEDQRLRWLTGQLWNCSDIMPSEVCSDLDMRFGSTYAMAARHLRVEL